MSTWFTIFWGIWVLTGWAGKQLRGHICKAHTHSDEWNLITAVMVCISLLFVSLTGGRGTNTLQWTCLEGAHTFWLSKIWRRQSWFALVYCSYHWLDKKHQAEGVNPGNVHKWFSRFWGAFWRLLEGCKGYPTLWGAVKKSLWEHFYFSCVCSTSKGEGVVVWLQWPTSSIHEDNFYEVKVMVAKFGDVISSFFSPFFPSICHKKKRGEGMSTRAMFGKCAQQFSLTFLGRLTNKEMQ